MMLAYLIPSPSYLRCDWMPWGWEGPPLVSRGNLPPSCMNLWGVRGTYPLFQGRIFHPWFMNFKED